MIPPPPPVNSHVLIDWYKKPELPKCLIPLLVFLSLNVSELSIRCWEKHLFLYNVPTYIVHICDRRTQREEKKFNKVLAGTCISYPAYDVRQFHSCHNIHTTVSTLTYLYCYFASCRTLQISRTMYKGSEKENKPKP